MPQTGGHATQEGTEIRPLSGPFSGYRLFLPVDRIWRWTKQILPTGCFESRDERLPWHPEEFLLPQQAIR
jgi:hypothetical protein